MKLVRRALAVVTPLALAACATVQEATRGQDRAAVLLSDRPAPREGCQISQRPSRLPALSEIADSAALLAGLRRLDEEERVGEGGFILLSLGWGASGQVERVKDIDWRLPQGAADKYRSLVQRSLRPQAPRTDLRLRVETGDPPRLVVGRSELCAPRVMVNFTLKVPAARASAEQLPVRARVVIGPQGEALDVVLLRPSGDSELDQFVLRGLRETRHLPGLIDGIAQRMDAEVTIPIRVE